MPHWPIPPWQKYIKYDLDRVALLLETLGNPHKKIPPTIHVAGTNGKGSTIAFLKSIFEHAGYKAHVYTSPHLIEFNERITLASQRIDDHLLFQYCERTRLAFQSLSFEPSFFEATTAIAFLAFSEIPADIVILETGMGGRLDATNIIDKPLATIITSISFDHMEYLGQSLPIIAREKAGIIKPGVPCIISNQAPEVFDVLFEVCEKVGAPSVAFQYDFGLEKHPEGFKYISSDYNLELGKLALSGEHQYLNAANAIACMRNIKGFNISDINIKQGIEQAVWPARLQQISPKKWQKMLGSNFEIWVDGAHNEAGAQMLSNWARDNHKTPLYMIFGMTKNRDVSTFLHHFEGLAVHIYGVLIEAEPSSYPAEKLKELARDVQVAFTACESIEDAICQITQDAKGAGGIVLVAGSLFLAGDFLRLSNVAV